MRTGPVRVIIRVVPDSSYWSSNSKRAPNDSDDVPPPFAGGRVVPDSSAGVGRGPRLGGRAAQRRRRLRHPGPLRGVLKRGGDAGLALVLVVAMGLGLGLLLLLLLVLPGPLSLLFWLCCCCYW